MGNHFGIDYGKTVDDVQKDTLSDFDDGLIEDATGADNRDDTISDFGDDLSEDTSGVYISKDNITDFGDDLPEDTLMAEKSPVKTLKRDELELIRACDRAVNQRLEITTDEYRCKGMSDAEIKERLSVDKWNFQRESLEDAFPGQDVSPNIFNGLSENGTRDRIAEINSNEELRRLVRSDANTDDLTGDTE